MIFVPVIIVIIFAIAFAPARPKSRRSKQGDLFSALLDGQKRTEKKNNSHRGVMCPPGGSKKKR